MSLVTRLAAAAALTAALAPTAAAQETKVVWQKSLSDAYRAMVAEKKPMLVCFTDSSPFAAKQRQLFAGGVLDPFHDRAVFVYADPDKDDRFQNVKRKIAELEVKKFPSLVLLNEKMEELGRIEGNVSEEELKKGLANLLGVPPIEWHAIRWEKATWPRDLAKVYDKAAAAKVPVVLVFLSPGCGTQKECACTRFTGDVLQSAEFRAYAGKGVFVLAEVPPDFAKATPAVAENASGFMAGWNVRSVPTLVVADPTPTGVRERTRIIGRFDRAFYMPRMVEAFDRTAEPKQLPKHGPEPATPDRLTRFLTDRKVPFERTRDGGFRTSVPTVDRSGVRTNVPVEVRVSENGRRLIVTTTVCLIPIAPAACERVIAALKADRGVRLAHGSSEITTDGGEVRLTFEVFNDLTDGAAQLLLDHTAHLVPMLRSEVEIAAAGGKK